MKLIAARAAIGRERRHECPGRVSSPNALPDRPTEGCRRTASGADPRSRGRGTGRRPPVAGHVVRRLAVGAVPGTPHASSLVRHGNAGESAQARAAGELNQRVAPGSARNRPCGPGRTRCPRRRRRTRSAISTARGKLRLQDVEFDRVVAEHRARAAGRVRARASASGSRGRSRPAGTRRTHRAGMQPVDERRPAQSAACPSDSSRSLRGTAGPRAPNSNSRVQDVVAERGHRRRLDAGRRSASATRRRTRRTGPDLRGPERRASGGSRCGRR